MNEIAPGGSGAGRNNMNIPNLNVKITGVEESTAKLNLLVQKLNEANSLIKELASTEVRIDFGGANEQFLPADD